MPFVALDVKREGNLTKDMVKVSKYLIYGLFDPRDGTLRYIGKTEGRLEKRMREHWCAAWLKHSNGKFKKNLHVYNWTRSLDGIKPDMVELEECTSHESLIEAEVEWIAEARRLGCDLTNHTDGGEGCFGYKHTAEAKTLMSKNLKGKPGRRGTGWKQPLEVKLQVSRTKTNLTAEQQKLIVDEYLSGASSYKVSEKYGVSAIVVSSLIDIFGYKMRTQAETMRKIKPEKEKELVDRYLAGESSNDLAIAFNVSGRSILTVLKRLGIKRRRAGSATKEERVKRLELNLPVSGPKGRSVCDQYGNVYRNIRDAASKLSIDKTAIWRVLNSKRHDVSGYVFQYLGEE